MVKNTNTRTLDVDRTTATAHRLHRYDGVCGNMHGHNMDWDVQVTVDMSYSGKDNMPLDLKDVSDLIDDVDHATVLAKDDPLLSVGLDDDERYDSEEVSQCDGNTVTVIDDHPLGEVFVFEGDPTCEMLSQWVANRLVDEIPAVLEAEVRVAETDKYAISTSASE